MIAFRLRRYLGVQVLGILATTLLLAACGAGGNEKGTADAAAAGSAAFAPSGPPAGVTMGPTRFTRTSGPPNTFTETVARCGGSCQLIVVNGEANGANRISAASVFLNGQPILGPSDFNQRVDRIVKPVSLQGGDQIRVELQSAPGAYLTISIECATYADFQIEAGPGIGTSTWPDGTLALSIPLVNEGNVAATDVSITGITAGSGSYQGPRPFAYGVGRMAPEEIRLLDALFSPAGSTPFALAVRGTYRLGAAQCSFETQRSIAPAAAPETITATPGVLVKQSPSTAQFPPAPPRRDAEPNAEQPIMLPLGPPRLLFPPTPTGTTVGTSAGGATVRIPRNTSMRSAGVPPDPNAAATAGGVVLATYNTGISFSTDGGQTFTDVNLFNPQPGNPARTSFFPASDGGLCCDQVVVYLPAQNLFVWLLQYWPVVNTAVTPNVITTPNRLRIAWATPAAIAADFWNAWTFGDLTGTNVAGVSSGLGIAANEWLDYPDLAWSDGFLYVGIDQGFPTPGLVYTGRRIVARLSLADMANPASTVVNYGFARLTGSNGLNKTHFVQGAPARMVVGSLDDSSTLRVFTWRDTENTIGSSTVPISQIQQGANYTSTAPDGSDWVAVGFPGNISGATYRSVIPGLGQPSRDEYLFAFTAGVNGTGRPRPYVRLETVTPSGSGHTAIAEYDIWNPDYAFAMAGLGSDGTEIGIALGVGGGTLGYPQFTVGFMNDFVVYQVTASNATQISRFGDYIAARLIPGAGLFAVEVYDVILNPLPPGTPSGTCATVGCSANMRYVEFGRPPVPGPR